MSRPRWLRRPTASACAGTDPPTLAGPEPEVDPLAPARRLGELAHALEAFADALRVDRARPQDERLLRDLASRARALALRPHPRAADLALVELVPRLVEPDHRATHSTYGHNQLRVDRAVDRLQGDAP